MIIEFLEVWCGEFLYVRDDTLTVYSEHAVGGERENVRAVLAGDESPATAGVVLLGFEGGVEGLGGETGEVGLVEGERGEFHL